jgi:hypothetical protein
MVFKILKASVCVFSNDLWQLSSVLVRTCQNYIVKLSLILFYILSFDNFLAFWKEKLSKLKCPKTGVSWIISVLDFP